MFSEGILHAMCCQIGVRATMQVAACAGLCVITLKTSHTPEMAQRSSWRYRRILLLCNSKGPTMRAQCGSESQKLSNVIVKVGNMGSWAAV